MKSEVCIVDHKDDKSIINIAMSDHGFAFRKYILEIESPVNNVSFKISLTYDDVNQIRRVFDSVMR